MWTDIGKSLNEDLLARASSRMNDMVYITAKKWYDNPANIQKLEAQFPSENVKKAITGKLWNGLIELLHLLNDVDQ